MYKAKNTHSLRSALLLGAASAAALGLAAPAMAQDQSVETVVVTGSRIPQTGLYSSSPVTAVGQQELQLQGTTKVENLLNNLPSVMAADNSTDSNGATGTASVDLRGLGTNRTLVLVDGNRLMPGDPSGNAADLNDIPAALVDHVEVLTGGASAIYGSDAVAGVVNFIMRKDFEGIEFDGQYSIQNAPNGGEHFDDSNTSQGYKPAPKNWWGGQNDDASFIMGANTGDGKGNVTMYLGYRHTSSVLQANLDFADCAEAGDFFSTTGCAGSSNYNRWKSLDTGAAYFGGTGVFVPYTGAPDQLYNFNPVNYMLRPDERYTGGFFGHYEVSKSVDVYTSFMFADDHTRAQIAQSAIFSASGPVQFMGTPNTHYYQINCSNPAMTAQENTLLCGTLPGDAFVADPSFAAGGYFNGGGNITAGQSLLDLRVRNVLGGNRVDDLRHTAYRAVIGAKGDLGNNWTYDVHGQYGISLLTEEYLNDLSAIRVENSLEVDPASGKCFAAEPDANGIINDPNCQPWDVFHGFSAPPNYVYGPGFQQGYTEEQLVSGNLTGDLGQWGIQSPWAKNPVALSVGAEWRGEYVELNPSYNFQIGDLTGQGTKVLPVPRSGFTVTEGFGEVRIPVVQGMPFFEDLTLNGGYRYSSYSSIGANTTYKYGAEWQPIDDFRLRVSWARASRAPNVLEFYLGNKVQLFQGGDPCAGDGVSPASSPQCAAVWATYGYTPASAASNLACPAHQCNAFVGGNQNLKAETSDTFSAGIVLTPTFLDGFTATVDYWDIKVADYIGTIPTGSSLNGCYGASASAAAQAYYCPNVHRGAATGSIYGGGYVVATNTNLPFIKTKGWDFEGNYTSDLGDFGWDALNGMGSISAHFIGTYTKSFEVMPSQVSLGSDITYDCAGYYGNGACGTPDPKWRHSLRVTWSSPWDVDFSVNWRHLSSVKLDSNSDNQLMGGGGTMTTCPAGSSIAGQKISTSYYGGDCGPGAVLKAMDYFDLAANWNVRDGISLRAGVDNVFAKRPPMATYTFMSNGNTFPGTYDSLGRTVFVGATIKY